MGYDYFLVLDDDYQSFHIRKPLNGILKSYLPMNLDALFKPFVTFLHNTPRLTSIALAQSGDFIGGVQNPYF